MRALTTRHDNLSLSPRTDSHGRRGKPPFKFLETASCLPRKPVVLRPRHSNDHTEALEAEESFSEGSDDVDTHSFLTRLTARDNATSSRTEVVKDDLPPAPERGVGL